MAPTSLVRSTLLPRVIGVLLAFGGLAYLSHDVAHLLAPGFAIHLVPRNPAVLAR
jgi:uncharacterized protein DUF4386